MDLKSGVWARGARIRVRVRVRVRVRIRVRALGPCTSAERT